MKSFYIPATLSCAFVLSIVISTSSAVTAQVADSMPASQVRSDCDKEVRRVPRASFYQDADGATVYTINGNESWRRTEVSVRKGNRVEIAAGGIVRWAPDGIEKIDVSPDGTRPPYRDGWNYNHFPFPSAGIGSLVMRIGKGVYPAGSSVVIEAEDDGFVEFMVNDDVLDDNSGVFLVKAKVLLD